MHPANNATKKLTPQIVTWNLAADKSLGRRETGKKKARIREKGKTGRSEFFADSSERETCWKFLVVLLLGGPQLSLKTFGATLRCFSWGELQSQENIHAESCQAHSAKVQLSHYPARMSLETKRNIVTTIFAVNCKTGSLIQL